MTVILRAAAAYCVLLFFVRLMGRRTVSMMAPMDLIVLFLSGGVFITAILDDDRSMTAGFTVVGTVGLMHVLVSWLKNHSDRFGRLVDGTPVVLYERGEWHDERMRDLRIEKQDVMAAVRQQGIGRLEQVRYAIAERDGKVSIIPDDA